MKSSQTVSDMCDKAARVGAAFAILAIVSLLVLATQYLGESFIHGELTRFIEVSIFGVAVGVFGCLICSSLLGKKL